jgi:hypothetical protein
MLAVYAVKFNLLVFFRWLIAHQAGHMQAWWSAEQVLTVATTAQTLIIIPLSCQNYSFVGVDE